MKKNADTTAQPRTAGRPIGTTLGALKISHAELIRILKTEEAPALIKVPKFQGGTNGKANSGRIYTPAAWNDQPVLVLKLSPDQAADIYELDGKGKGEAIRNATKD